MRNPWLCILIVLSLGAAALAALGGAIALALYGRPVPEFLTGITFTAIGSLSSFLVMPPRGSVGSGEQKPDPSPPAKP